MHTNVKSAKVAPNTPQTSIAKSNVLDAGDGKAWYSLFVSGLDRLKLFNKYGTVVWGLILLFAISHDALWALGKVQETGKMVYVLELAETINYSVFIVLTPVSLYQLKKHSSEDRILAAPLNLWIIVLTLISMSTAGVMYGIGNTSTVSEVLLDLIYPVVDTLCTLTTMLVFGIVFSGFKSKCKSISNSENCPLQKYRELLTEYRNLKKGSEFGLFTLFTCFTISLVIWTYICFASVDNCHETDDDKIAGFVDIISLILGLVYFAFAAHDCHSNFLSLANHLR